MVQDVLTGRFLSTAMQIDKDPQVKRPAPFDYKLRNLLVHYNTAMSLYHIVEFVVQQTSR